jgi:hypothetical protein
MSNFTPGPWDKDVTLPLPVSNDDYHSITAGRGYYPEGFNLTGFMSKADLALIAQAPFLYKALNDLLDLHENDISQPAVNYARLLINVIDEGASGQD